MARLTITTADGDVDLEVLVDGYRKGINESGPWRDVIYSCPWDQSDAVMDALLGLVSATVPGSTIVFPIPHRYPGNARLLCMWVQAEGTNMGRDDGKLIAGDTALIEAHYGVPPFDFDGQDHHHAIGGRAYPFTKFESRGYTENASFPASALGSAPGGKKLDGTDADADLPLTRNVQIEMPAQEIVVTRYYSPYNPDNDPAFRGSVGHLNDDVFLNRDAGTVKFESYDTDPQTTPDGSPVTTVRMVFRWRLYDWNAVPVDDDGQIAWVPVADQAGAGDTLFGYTNLLAVLEYGL